MGRPSLPPDLRGLNVRDLLEDAAARHPTRAAVRTRDRVLTYTELDAEATRAAAAWQELGVRKGDRVAFMADNSPEFLAAWLGLAKAGGVLVAINTRFKAAETRFILQHTRPAHVLASIDHLDVVREALAADAPKPLSLGETRGAVDLLGLLERSPSSYDRVDLAADDAVSFILTSGTTGTPKAVVQTHGNYVLTGQAYPAWLELDPGDAVYCCLPLFHVNAQAYSTMGALALGGTLGLVERFSASRFWSDVREMDARAFNYIGAMIAILLQREQSAEERDHRVRIGYGAPSFPAEQRHAIEERFGLVLMSGFGMSETTFGMVESPYGERRSASVGKLRWHPDPRIVNEARIIDDDGRDLGDGEVGELLLRNPVTMREYWNDPERTGEAFHDGWLRTGDYVTRDEDGFYFFVDRKKDIVRRRGENVSSLEVELVLQEHPDVDEAAVLGVPAELTDEELLAVVVPRTGVALDGAELVEWCATRLADFKVPRYVAFVASLPKTPTQKVEKVRLRDTLPPRAEWQEPAAAQTP